VGKANTLGRLATGWWNRPLLASPKGREESSGAPGGTKSVGAAATRERRSVVAGEERVGSGMRRWRPAAGVGGTEVGGEVDEVGDGDGVVVVEVASCSDLSRCAKWEESR